MLQTPKHLLNIKSQISTQEIDWDDICFKIAERLYGHDKEIWSLPFADLRVIQLVQEFLLEQSKPYDA